jgi:hypothetical protein
MPINTNFNVNPYFDDYDEAKNYYKVLFRPSTAIQARELNQMQTILQKQIDRFGQHIFKNGSIVLDGSFDYEHYIDTVKVVSLTQDLESSYFVGKIVTGSVSGVEAYVKHVDYDFDNNVYVFFVRYTKSGTDTNFFLTDEIVTDNSNPNNFFKTVEEDCNSVGTIFSISQGVMFSKGFFAAFPAQTVALSFYTTTPSVIAGFKVVESIITDLQDPSLLDNALGSPNENAPGAHRFAVDPTLTVVDYDAEITDPDFSILVVIKNGIIEQSKERTEYARIYDEFAKRTYDESGDYYVSGFNARVREHLNVNSNEGLFSLAEGGDSQKLTIDIDPGVAYVKGYEVNKLVTQHIITDKGIEYESENGETINARTSGYYLVKEAIGTLSLDTGTLVNLYNTAEQRITNKTTLSTANTGALIGTARVKYFAYDSGSQGSANGSYRLYLYDTQLTNGNIANVRSVGISSTFFADIQLNSNSTPIFNDYNLNTLLYKVNTNYTRSLRGNNGISDTIFNFSRTETKTTNFATGGILTLSLSGSDQEELSYSTGSLSSTEKRTILLTVNANKDIHLFSPSGVVSGTSGQGNLTGTSTYFSRLNAGDRIKVNGSYYFVNTVYSDTSMSIVGTLSSSPVSNVIYRSYMAGDIVDLTIKGSSGVTRNVSLSSSGVMTVDLKEDTSNTTGSVSCSITYNITRSGAQEVKKILSPRRYVMINTATNVANTVGPYNLGLPDVYRVRSVRIKTGAFVNNTDGDDVTSYFALDDGQRDCFYDHASLIFKGGIDIKNKYLLVQLDHFEADYTGGAGYFSVDSYPVDDTTVSESTIFTYQIPVYATSYGEMFELRNAMDFRPYKTATAASTQATSTGNISAATVNPATTTSMYVPTGGLRTSIPGSNMYIDYSYYLARRDLIAVDTNGNFILYKGKPDINPISPIAPDNVMPLVKALIKPYPSLSETYARQLGNQTYGCTAKNIANRRYTMKDIGTIKNRVDNLDYYNALTLLEKTATDLNITDAATGLDRFKNGFFVDGFVDHSLGDTRNDDYRCSIDPKENCIRPFHEADSVKYQYQSTGSSGVQLTGSLVTRPYTETVLLSQKNISTRRNIEYSVYRFVGRMTFRPETDIWHDQKTVDKKITYGDDLPNPILLSTEWTSWEKYGVGKPVYNVYSTNEGGYGNSWNGGKSLEGSFSSYKEALDFAKPVKTNTLPANYYAYNAGGGYNPRTPYYLANGQLVTGYFGWSTNPDIAVQMGSGNLGSNTPDNFMRSFAIEGTDPGTTERRSKVEKSLDWGTETQTLGSFVTDVTLATYIRPQTITIIVQGLKARTRYWVYFDSENMTSYCSQWVASNLFGAKPDSYKTEGAELITNDGGDLVFDLRLPTTGKRFKVGTKEVIVTDSPTNAVDATSHARGYWTSLGINAQKQNTIVSTVVPTIETNSTPEERFIPGKGQTLEIWACSCMAYSFKVDVPPTEDGIFLTSVDIFIESMHPTLGVWFEIREMNAGGVTKNQVPYSEVWMKRTDPRIKLNPVGTTNFQATKVNFPAPVYLMNNTSYAFVIHTEGLNPDTYFWVSRLGETDVLTNSQITSRRLTGTLYTTNNNTNYDMVPDVDLTCTFNRANFAVGSGTAMLGNIPVEYIKLKSGAGAFTNYGEEIVGSAKLALTSIVSTGNTIVIGDILTGSSSGAVGNVTAVGAGSLYSTTGIGFSNTETVTVKNSSGTLKNISATVNGVYSGSGKLKSYDSANNIFIIEDSNGLYLANGVVKGVRSANVGVIDSFTYYPYSTTCLKPHYLTFRNTSCGFEKRGWRSDTNAYGNYYPGIPDVSSDFYEENKILSRVNEISLNSSNPSSQARATLTTSSVYVSPVIDLSRGNSVYVHNLINADDPDVLILDNIDQGANTIIIGDKIVGTVNGYVTSIIGNTVITDVNGYANAEIITVYESTGTTSKGISANVISVSRSEDQISGGSLINRYISKVITLAEGQDAEDLIVKITAYRPVGTDVKVWFKVANAEDYQGLSNKKWTPMVYFDSIYSSSVNNRDFLEFDYSVNPDNYDGNGILQYTSEGNTFKGFKQFQIKIGLYGNADGISSALVPKVGDLRVIALQR